MFLQNFAQSTAECTVNGQAVDCGDAAKAAGGILAGFGIFMLLFFAFGIFSTVIWILSLIHLIQHEDVENRMVWIILVFLVPLANFVYYFGFRRSYNKHKAASPDQPASPAAPGSTPGAVTPQNTSSDSSNVAAGAVAGGAAASSGFSDQSPSSTPDISSSDSSNPQPGMDIGMGDDNTSSSDNPEVAQADSAPAYPGSEDSSTDTSPSSETTDTVSPDTDSYQSGSTEEPKIPSDDSTPGQSDDSSGDTSGPDDQSSGGDAGPSIG